jgi:hypothetical protein
MFRFGLRPSIQGALSRFRTPEEPNMYTQKRDTTTFHPSSRLGCLRNSENTELCLFFNLPFFIQRNYQVLAGLCGISCHGIRQNTAEFRDFRWRELISLSSYWGPVLPVHETAHQCWITLKKSLQLFCCYLTMLSERGEGTILPGWSALIISHLTKVPIALTR